MLHDCEKLIGAGTKLSVSCSLNILLRRSWGGKRPNLTWMLISERRGRSRRKLVLFQGQKGKEGQPSSRGGGPCPCSGPALSGSVCFLPSEPCPVQCSRGVLSGWLWLRWLVYVSVSCHGCFHSALFEDHTE